MPRILELWRHLPEVEARRHTPTLQLLWLVGRIAYDKNPPALQDWTPPYAIRDDRKPEKDRLRADLKIGVELRMASQDLYDAVQEFLEDS